jgi:hypothetical protein
MAAEKVSPRTKAIAEAVTWADKLVQRARDAGKDVREALMTAKQQQRATMRDLHEADPSRDVEADKKRRARARYFEALARVREIDGNGPGTRTPREAPQAQAPRPRRARAQAPARAGGRAPEEAPPQLTVVTQEAPRPARRPRPGFTVQVWERGAENPIRARDGRTMADARNIAQEALGANPDAEYAVVVQANGTQTRVDRAPAQADEEAVTTP